MNKYKTVFEIDDSAILRLNVIRKRDVLNLWMQIRSEVPRRIWIGLVSCWEKGMKVRNPAWIFLDESGMCYVYFPYSHEISLLGLYHRQYPPILWIYCRNYYCGYIDGKENYVGLIAVGNVMMTF